MAIELKNLCRAFSIYSQSVEAGIQNQITIRDSTNITDKQMEEFRTSFEHFDKDKSVETLPLLDACALCFIRC